MEPVQGLGWHFRLKEWPNRYSGTMFDRIGPVFMAQRPSQTNPEKLRKAGLRPTRQRLALAQLLFARGDRHVTAEGLHEEAVSAGVPVSLATV